MTESNPVSHRRRHPRGSALTEFALVVPLFVTILFFSMYFTELLRVKFKVQEMSRFIAWEMSSYMLTDFAGGDHAGAFEHAAKELKTDVLERYKDLDSVEDDAGNENFIGRFSNLKIEIGEADASFIDDGNLSGAGKGALNLAKAGIGMITGAWGFNNGGRAVVDVSVDFTPKIFKADRYMMRGEGGFYSVDQTGNRDLSSLTMKSHYTMVANGWHLPDGAPATLGEKRAGLHETGSDSGLYMQVNKMTFLGLKGLIDKTPGLKQVKSVLSYLPIPELLGTYVISLPYDAEANVERKCNNESPGLMGENDFEYPGIEEAPYPNNLRCFDTAPFRDTWAWNESLYAKAFKARGNHFMGCKNPMADDPTVEIGDLPKSSQDDKNKAKTACGP